MLDALIWATIAVCVVSAVTAYAVSHDVFHPAILLSALCAFIYGYMPLSLVKSQLLFAYVTESQADFCQTLAFLGTLAMMAGCFSGAAPKAGRTVARTSLEHSPQILQRGGYVLGVLGLACWVITIRGAGGLTGAFGHGDGMGWSDIGYIRDGVYLLVVALILLLTPQAFRHRDRVWYISIVVFTTPWLMQGLLGARRGPTFVIACTIGMSWYLARGKRPSLPLLVGAAAALGGLMLFLVTNRDRIYLGSDFSGMKTDVTNVVTDANESNEYIFGIGCIETARQTSHYFWGRRYLAEILVRPIPHQLWPNKYQDFGVGELTQNAGVAGEGLAAIMGWGEIPGAAAAMIADLWVEFSWFIVPVLFGIGYMYGYVWRRTVEEGGPWNSQFTIICVLAVYLVTQSGEAVIFRFFILTIPTSWVWRKARLLTVRKPLAARPLYAS
jgi:hypothetical protein